ncbi:MAG TPA: HTTM domain-containing protein [Polyangiaceae bacterium]|nr:HTTM domain-containing protein [Polyangiaceae bacterium]
MRLVAALDRFLFEPIDARVYAAVRVAYAVVCLAVVAELWPVRRELFCGAMIPRAPSPPWYLPMAWVTSPAGVSAVLVGAAVCAGLAAVGLLTRLAVVGLYLWSFSYAYVAYPAETGYDGLVRLAGLALAVSPAARAWSLDGLLRPPRSSWVPRYGLRLLQWQLAIVYAVTVWLKAPDPYWRGGDLMSYFMMSIFARHPDASWATMGRTSALLTWGTLVLETSIPVMLFTRRGRRWGFLCGLALHGGIALESTIGLFSLAMTPYYAAFLRAEDFDDLARVGRSLRDRVSRRPA